MNLSRIFIERPVMTVLVVFAILLFGTIAFRVLPESARYLLSKQRTCCAICRRPSNGFRLAVWIRTALTRLLRECGVLLRLPS